MQPTYYIPHGGGPCFFMDDPTGMWKDMELFLRDIMASLPRQPSAILVVSSHWEEKQFTVTSHPSPSLVYDYYGFPEHTYRLRYPVPGYPTLAARVVDLLNKAKIPAGADARRGLDHGVFIPLMLIAQEATIPVVQLSLKTGLSPQEHLAAGAALTPLRSEGVLIIGSGMSYHNMQGFSKAYTPASEAFDAWLTDAICGHSGAMRNLRLTEWEQAPHARTCHPREEHLISLHLAAGAAYDDKAKREYSGHVLNVAVSGFRFG